MREILRGADYAAQIVEGRSGRRSYRNLVEQMQEGAAVLTGDGRIVYCNPGFATLVGEPIESVMASRFDRFVHAPDRSAFETMLHAGSGRVRSRLVTPASGACEVSLSLITTKSPAGDRLDLTVTDLTRILKAISDRVRAERDSCTKDEFLAVLAHELRNPIGAISNAVEVLELTHGDGEQATAAHQVIGRQVAHISHLIDGLLDVERVASGKARLNREPLDLAESARRAVATFISDPGLNRHIDLSTEPVWVEGDAVRLHQVLTNILTNAMKYTPSGGRIAVVLGAEGPDAVLSVEDRGFGISARLIPFIFDKYVQADRTLDRAGGGLGLGLTLVRRLVEMHDGTIAASSDGEGQGSRFTIRLPRISASDTAARVHQPIERRARPRRVLLIEDNADAREMLRMMLEIAGHAVYAASDGESGFELVDIVRPDVAIIDIGLPRMDGYEVARRIRQQYGNTMLLLALTGYSAAADVDRALAHGFNHHLVKPVDPDQLAQLLDRTNGPLFVSDQGLERTIVP